MNKRILLVDDEVGSTRLLKANLEMTQAYEVRVENQPENAVRAAREFRPDFVLLDMVMPQMSGADVAKAFHQDPELRRIPIALLSAADTSLVPRESEKAVTSLPRISKPASMEQILGFLDANVKPIAPMPHAHGAAPGSTPE